MPRTIVLTLSNDDEVVDRRALTEIDAATIGAETMEAARSMLYDAGGLVPGDVLTITEEVDGETAEAAP